MKIDPKIEKPTRTMLDHAIKGELQELDTAIHAEDDETYRQSVALCLAAAGYIAIDVSGRWPTSADKWEISRRAAQAAAIYKVADYDIYNYLSRVALGTERLDDVFERRAETGTLPLLITAGLLVSYRPQGKDWGQYLDTIEAAIKVADGLDLSVLPAITLMAHRQPAA